MSFKEVKELRQAGKLNEALEKAKSDLEHNPDDIWNKRSIGWVYYDYLKHSAEVGELNSLYVQLDNIESLELPSSELMLFDSIAFQIGKIIFALNRKNQINTTLLDKLFTYVKKMHFTKPSDAYSFLHKAFLKASNGWDKYCEFADWWGYDNFQKSDYVEEEYNSKTMMSTVEQAYIHYAKSLTMGSVITDGDPLGIGRRELDMTRITLFLQQLDNLIEKHPNYVYPPYYKAKLLLLQGGKQEALESFLPFAKQKKNDFWVWDLMADIFKDDKEKRMACFCKALSCRIPGSFLVKTRQRFAEFLISQGLYNEAKFEIDQLVKDRDSNGWRTPNVVLNWKGQDWYNTASNRDSNKDFYLSHINHAEEILFSSDPKETILVTHVNKEKQIISYVIDKSNSGFFKYKGLINNPKTGGLYDVRIAHVDSDNGFTKIGTIEKSHLTDHPMLKEEEGEIRMKNESTFAFLNNTFIDPKSVKKHNLSNGDRIKIRSILSFNKSKNEWGWKMIDLVSKID